MLLIEDIDTSLGDYEKALSILERLVEPDSRQLAELYPLTMMYTSGVLEMFFMLRCQSLDIAVPHLPSILDTFVWLFLSSSINFPAS